MEGNAEEPLTDANMTQVINQLKNVEKFTGDKNALYTFINRIDYLLALYTTNDARQRSILFGLVERCISSEVMLSLGVNNLMTWTDLRKQLVLNYKTQTKNHTLLEEFRSTPFKGNVRAFLEEAEHRRQTLMSKLELENNFDEKTLYARLIKTSIDDLIQKLPTNICIRIVNCEIPDLRSLINILQEKNLYNEPCLNPTPNKVRQEKYLKPLYQPNPNIQRFPTFLQPNQPYVPYRPHQPYIQQPYHQPSPNYTNNNTFKPNNHSPQPMQQIPSPIRPTYFTPRPIIRQNQFDNNRFGQVTPQQNSFNNSGVANQPTKRVRPAESGQSKMSIDQETRNQEELNYHEYMQQEYDNQCAAYPEYYPQYYQAESYPQNPDFTYTQSAEHETEQPNEIEIEQAENFQQPALETNST